MLVLKQSFSNLVLKIVGINMPEKANYRIMGEVQNVPGDGTNKKM